MESAPREKKGLHPRNRHRDRYDFALLTASCPDLAPFVAPNRYGDESIDFANPEAVKTLNRAILKHFYGISSWDIPVNYLCPPIPGRADYVHHVADLLASSHRGVIPRGESLRVLDIGVGANAIYPLIGHREYGWRFLGSDIDPVALASASRIVSENGLTDAIQLRVQTTPSQVLKGLLQPGELFDVSICNPPFHASLEEAREGTRRKWKNLGQSGKPAGTAPVLNFGGQGAELWCAGGESAFVRRMIDESTRLATRCFWFSTLLSKESNVPGVLGALRKAGVVDSRTIEMSHGQKKSRIIAWTFLSPEQQAEWRSSRWG